MSDERQNEPDGEPKKAELAARAAALGVPTSGTKADLADRIAEEAKKAENEPFFQGYYTTDVPIYGCPNCYFTYRSSGEVMWHIRGNHPDQGGND